VSDQLHQDLVECLLVRNLMPEARVLITLDEPSRWILAFYSLNDGFADKEFGVLGTVSVELPITPDETTIPHVPTMKVGQTASSTHHVMVVWLKNIFRHGLLSRKGRRGNEHRDVLVGRNAIRVGKCTVGSRRVWKEMLIRSRSCQLLWRYRRHTCAEHLHERWKTSVHG
jgi:hypothetical protein